MLALKALAVEDRTIVATIHQPSSQMFQMFDRLFLMAEGRIVFAGKPSEVADVFDSYGFRFPKDYGLSDYCCT